MLLESKINKKQWICNEASIVRYNDVKKKSYVINSLDRDELFFVYRSFAFGCFRVLLYRFSISSELPLTHEENKYFEKIRRKELS